MRPQSIVRFEWLSLLSLALAAVIIFITWEEIGAVMDPLGSQAALLRAAYVIAFALMLALVLLTSRKASKAAKWIVVLLIVVGAGLTLRDLPDLLGDGLIGIADLVQVALQLAALYFLFTPEARRWFTERSAGRPDASSEGAPSDGSS